jgi:RNA polymerase sigma-70 factor (ECF subfamily)
MSRISPIPRRFDDEAGFAAISTPGDDLDGKDLGQQFESFRAYLLMVAGQEMNGELRGKCGASDLVQETLCEAHRDRAAFRGRTSRDLRAWLRGILLNTIRDVARSYAMAKRKIGLEVPMGRVQLRGLIDPELTPGARAVAREHAEAVDAALARLPEDYRRVIDLRSREHRPFGEIGQLLGRSTDAARMLWFRALERLQQELGEPDGAGTGDGWPPSRRRRAAPECAGGPPPAPGPLDAAAGA